MFSTVRDFLKGGFEELNEVFIKPFSNLSFYKKCFLIICLGMLIYIPYLNGINANHDEQYTMLLFRYSWQDMIKLISVEDGHPPLYHMIYRFFQLGGDYHNIFALRMTTLVIMLLTALLGVFPLRRLVGDSAAVAFVFCVFFLPSSFYLAINIRMYPLALYVMTGAFIYSNLLCIENKKRNWLYFAAFSIAGLYTHYFCAIMLFLIWSSLFVRLLIAKQIKKIGLLILTGLLVGLTFVPWLIVFYQQYTNMKGTWFPSENHYMYAIYGGFFDFRGFNNPLLACLMRFFGFFCWILVFEYLCEKVSKNKKSLVLNAIFVFWGLYLVALLVSVLLRPMLFGRLMVVPMGCLYIALSISLVQLTKYRKLFIVLFVPMLLLCYTVYYQIANDKGISKFKADFEEQIAKDSLIIYNDTWTHLFMMFYLPQYETLYAPNKPYIILFQDEVLKERSRKDDLDKYSKIYYFTPPMFEDKNGKMYFLGAEKELFLKNIYSDENLTLLEISKQEAHNLIKKTENNFQLSLH